MFQLCREILSWNGGVQRVTSKTFQVKVIIQIHVDPALLIQPKH